MLILILMYDKKYQGSFCYCLWTQVGTAHMLIFFFLKFFTI